MNWDYTITTAPYNTLNLPPMKGPNLTNPQNNLEAQYNSEAQYESVYNPRQTHKASLGNETNFVDPTKQIVNNYLKSNISMYDNRGKYFDSYLFNQKFDEYIIEKNNERLLKEKVQLYDLDRIDNIQISPYELPLDKLLIKFKNFWFKLFDDLIKFKNPLSNFTINNFFYLGISLIIIFILYIILSLIFD